MGVRRRKDAANKLPERLRRLSEGAVVALRGLLAALPLSLILAGAGWGSITLWQHAFDDPRFKIGGDTLSLSGSARFGREAVQEIKRLGKQAKGRSLFEPGLLAELRREYEASPWVRRVCSLRRVFPNRVSVEFVLRSPLVQVRQSGYYWQVDRDGVLLPVPGARRPWRDLPEVVATSAKGLARRPRDGGEWRDPGVRDALDVLQLLRASPLSEDLHVRRIRVSRGSFLDRLQRPHLKRPRLYLETAEGVSIRWGGFNRGDFPEEKLNSEKIADLRHFVARGVAAVPGITLDVSTRQPTYRLLRPE